MKYTQTPLYLQIEVHLHIAMPKLICIIIKAFHFSFSFSVIGKLIILPNNKNSGQSKLKLLAIEKIIVTEKLKFVFRIGENFARKGENVGYQHFLLSPGY